MPVKLLPASPPVALTPASSVVAETAFGQASAVGSSLLYARQDHTHGTPAVPTKADVGLGNADNTSDANKPVSTAQQTALDAKQPLDSDLTAIAALSPANDDLLQRKSDAWTFRTPTQVKADLGLSTAAKTDAPQTFTDTQTFSKAIKPPTSSGSAEWMIDVSGGTTLSVAVDATATPFGASNNFSGMILVNDPSVSGATALFLVGGGTAALIGQTSAEYSHTAGTAGKINLYVSGSAVTIQNKKASTINFRIAAIRMRTSG